MTELQDLLDREARLSNIGLGNTDERQELITMIRLKRDDAHRPDCFGLDDCSTMMLLRCPWRMDCGE